jgi:hypothetical protein
LLIDIPKLGILLDEEKLFVIIDTYKQFFPPPPPSASTENQPVSSASTVASTNDTVNPDILQMQISLNVGLFNISIFELTVVDTKESIFPLDFSALTSEAELTNSGISDDAFIKLHIKGRDLDKKHKLGSKSDAYLLISRLSGNLKVQLYKSGKIDS